MNESRLEELLDAYFDGRMTAEEKAELQPMLLATPEARQMFWKYAEQHSLIGEVLMQESGRELAEDDAVLAACAASSEKRRHASSRRLKSIRRSMFRPDGSFKAVQFALAAAAAALLVAGVFFAGSSPAPRRAVAEREGSTEPVAPAIDVYDPAGSTDEGRGAPAAAPEADVARIDTSADEPGQDPQPHVATPNAAALAAVEVREPPRTSDRLADLQRPDVVAATGAQHQAYVDSIEGGKPWLVASGATAVTHLAAGHPLRAGDRIRTGQSRMRIVFDSGTALYLNRKTSLTFKGGISLFLGQGDVYVETVRADTGFSVATKYGVALDLGTRFGVEARSHRTTVVVVEGEVEASTDQGAVNVVADHEALLVHKVGAPSAPKRVVDAERRFAWANRPPRRVVIVRGSDPPTVTETLMFARLEEHNCALETVVEKQAKLSDLSRADLVIVSSTTGSGDIAVSLRTCAAPVICWETWLYPDMKLTGPRTRIDFNYDETARRIVIEDEGHPLSAGLSGTVTVYRTPYKLGWGLPLEGVKTIATVEGSPDNAAILYAERGATVDGEIVPARRLGLFIFDDPVTLGGLTPDGWKLFDAAVAWCLEK